MRSALLLAALAFLAVSADVCYETSWAVPAANGLAAVPELETGIDFSAALSQIWGVYSKTTSKLAPQLSYGIGISGNFYSLIDCSSGAVSLNYYCYQGCQYVFATVNYAYFLDWNIHYFCTVDGAIATSVPFYNSTSAYIVSEQPWYTLGNGWTDPVMGSNGVSQETYSASFTGGVAVATRVGTEPCSPCLTGSFPTAWANSWAHVQSRGASLTTFYEVIAYAQDMIIVVKSFTDEIFTEVFIGFDNEYFYDIGDCRNPNQNCPVPLGYAFYARNDVVFGHPNLTTVYLNQEGNVYSDAKFDDVFVTTSRPWFTQGGGWSQPYESETGEGLWVRAYSSPLKGGVVAGEIVVNISDTTGTCYNGRYSSSEYYYALYNSGERLGVMLPLVLIALLKMFF